MWLIMYSCHCKHSNEIDHFMKSAKVGCVVWHGTDWRPQRLIAKLYSLALRHPANLAGQGIELVKLPSDWCNDFLHEVQKLLIAKLVFTPAGAPIQQVCFFEWPNIAGSAHFLLLHMQT
mmetsp:Transcript_53005/g.115667  ORF Transcript_53005/g.115667 Transcript_53005/m.115667 type:complete len:119 (+) Transcript_53005:732-1088(+)